MKKTLTPEQTTAIQEYAAVHGRTWKSQLSADWLQGRTTGALQVLRNAFGPSWLVGYKLPKGGQ